jgi:hypothetical protein
MTDVALSSSGPAIGLKYACCTHIIGSPLGTAISQWAEEYNWPDERARIPFSSWYHFTPSWDGCAQASVL